MSRSGELKLHQYQEDVIQRALGRQHFAALLDPGLGKTIITLEAFRRLREQFEVSRLLVVAPLRVATSVWPAEVAKWEAFRDLRVQVLHKKTLRPELLQPGTADVLVTNPESLFWLEKAARRIRLPEMLAIDESTLFKHVTTKRSRVLRRLKGRFAKRLILTGSPAPNGLQDLHGQMHILHEDILGATLREFRSRYCCAIPTRWGAKWEVRTEARADIYRAIRPWSVRLAAEDHLDLPNLVEINRSVTLPPRARKKYEELQRDLATRWKAGEVTAANAGVLTAKLRQIASGSVYLDDEGAVQVHGAKIEALRSLVEELSGKPLLVAYEFRHEIPMIQKGLYPVLQRKVPFIGGQTSAPEGDRLVRAWNRGELPVLLVQAASASRGLNLQAGGHHLAWFTQTWNLEFRDQLIRRLYRQGQREERVVVHTLMAEDTVDQLVALAVRRKAATQEELFRALERRLGEV